MYDCVLMVTAAFIHLQVLAGTVFHSLMFVLTEQLLADSWLNSLDLCGLVGAFESGILIVYNAWAILSSDKEMDALIHLSASQTQATRLG